jgi:hypothetical protein
MTDPSPESSLKELTGLAPILVPAFAFAFVVGYFSGIDISWLSFFSLKDHALFALRALPVAITASLFFAFGLNSRHLSKQFSWIYGYRRHFAIVWAVILLAFAAESLYEARVGLGISFIGMALGHWLYYKTTLPHRAKPSVLDAHCIAETLYWAGTLMFVSIIVGYVSALPCLLELQRHSSIKNGSTIIGNVIFSGDKYLLVWQSRSDSPRIADCRPPSPATIENTAKGYVRLLQWKTISTIDLCPNQPPAPPSPSPQQNK